MLIAPTTLSSPWTSVEVCAGAGGQAIGLEAAGFQHAALVEIDANACTTLRTNRPHWKVLEKDLQTVTADMLTGGVQVDLLAGGVPCPPFSLAGKQLGKDDDRDLFPAFLRLTQEMRPRALMIENVRGLMQGKFDAYRARVVRKLSALGYMTDWRVVYSSHFGVPQLRPRSILVAMKPSDMEFFQWPQGNPDKVKTIGKALGRSMASAGWEGAQQWAKEANKIAPTLVGGSKKHGGADLGPTRARAGWLALGIDGRGLADELPGPGFAGLPRLTVQQAALVQGFPAHWRITGRKTAAYRQVGNAFPPPVAKAFGNEFISAFTAADSLGASRPLSAS
ncbi:MAG: DNA cytosine methyltransferase [Mycobacteriaceae bacterium]